MDYVSGVGVRSGLRYATASLLSAVTGDGNTGCSAKIKEVYKVGSMRQILDVPS
jgi:hypothetical protein